MLAYKKNLEENKSRYNKPPVHKKINSAKHDNSMVTCQVRYYLGWI